MGAEGSKDVVTPRDTDVESPPIVAPYENNNQPNSNKPNDVDSKLETNSQNPEQPNVIDPDPVKESSPKSDPVPVKPPSDPPPAKPKPPPQQTVLKDLDSSDEEFERQLAKDRQPRIVAKPVQPKPEVLTPPTVDSPAKPDSDDDFFIRLIQEQNRPKITAKRVPKIRNPAKPVPPSGSSYADDEDTSDEEFRLYLENQKKPRIKAVRLTTPEETTRPSKTRENTTLSIISPRSRKVFLPVYDDPVFDTKEEEAQANLMRRRAYEASRREKVKQKREKDKVLLDLTKDTLAPPRKEPKWNQGTRIDRTALEKVDNENIPTRLYEPRNQPVTTSTFKGPQWNTSKKPEKKTIGYLPYEEVKENKTEKRKGPHWNKNPTLEVNGLGYLKHETNEPKKAQKRDKTIRKPDDKKDNKSVRFAIEVRQKPKPTQEKPKIAWAPVKSKFKKGKVQEESWEPVKSRDHVNKTKPVVKSESPDVRKSDAEKRLDAFRKREQNRIDMIADTFVETETESDSPVKSYGRVRRRKNNSDKNISEATKLYLRYKILKVANEKFGDNPVEFKPPKQESPKQPKKVYKPVKSNIVHKKTDSPKTPKKKYPTVKSNIKPYTVPPLTPVIPKTIYTPVPPPSESGTDTDTITSSQIVAPGPRRSPPPPKPKTPPPRPPPPPPPPPPKQKDKPKIENVSKRVRISDEQPSVRSNDQTKFESEQPPKNVEIFSQRHPDPELLGDMNPIYKSESDQVIVLEPIEYFALYDILSVGVVKEPRAVKHEKYEKPAPLLKPIDYFMLYEALQMGVLKSPRPAVGPHVPPPTFKSKPKPPKRAEPDIKPDEDPVYSEFVNGPLNGEHDTNTRNGIRGPHNVRNKARIHTRNHTPLPGQVNTDIEQKLKYLDKRYVPKSKKKTKKTKSRVKWNPGLASLAEFPVDVDESGFSTDTSYGESLLQV